MDFTVYKGDTKAVEVAFIDADTSAVLDITDGTAQFRVQQDGTDLLTKTNGVGQHYQPANGLSRFGLSAVETSALPAGVLRWAAELTLNGAVRVVESGNFTVLKR